jgi:hypothetical protein
MSAFGDIPFSMGYDDQYLYLSGHLAGINDGSHTYRATAANIGVPEEICDGIAEIDGRIYGDYFYRPQARTSMGRCFASSSERAPSAST